MCYHVWREAAEGHALFIVRRCFRTRAAAQKWATAIGRTEWGYQLNKCRRGCPCGRFRTGCRSKSNDMPPKWVEPPDSPFWDDAGH